MGNHEPAEAEIRSLAHDAVVLIEQQLVNPSHAAAPGVFIAGAALARLSQLLRVQLNSGGTDYEVLALSARAVLETWLTGHAALLLGEQGAQLLDRRAQFLTPRLLPTPAAPGPATENRSEVSLEDLARHLDVAVYGETERPKAFRRHLASFFDEIDITGAEGTIIWLARYMDDRETRQVRTTATASDRPADFIRVSLWVTLFLAHDYFAAVDELSTARAARALYDRLRRATDGFYSRRKSDSRRSR